MTSIASLLDHPSSQALAWTLLNFVWQGALLGLACVAAMRLFTLSSTARYAVGVATLALMLAAPLLTFGALTRASAPAVTAVPPNSADLIAFIPTERPAESAAAAPGNEPVGLAPSRIEAAVLAVWLLGVTVLSVRLVGGWVVARRLTRRSVRPASREVESLALRIAGRLALDRVVRIAESSVVAVPVLVGWLKPVVLLPASALSGLTPTQIEALLAHELAHVRRHDYLVNILQSAVETLLFYHPAVWWVSREVRREREHCCDDLAVGVCDRVEYVTALANLAALTSLPKTVLAATDGSLVGRVRRLLSPGEERPSTSAGWVAAAVVAVGAVLAGASMSAALVSDDTDQTPVAGPAVSPEPAVSAVPAQDPPPPPPPPPAPPAPVRVKLAPILKSAPVRVRVAPTLPSVPVRVKLRPIPPPAAPQVVPPVPPAPPGPPPAPPPPDVTQDVKRAQEVERVAHALELQWREAQRDIDLKRLELELQRAKIESQVRMESAKAQLEILTRQMDKTREMVAVGLSTPEAQAALESQLMAAKQTMQAVQAELEIRQADIGLRRRETEARSEYETRLRALEGDRREQSVRARADEERARALLAGAERAREAAVTAARANQSALHPDSARHVQDQIHVLEELLASARHAVAADEQAKAGDVLQIQIVGEPELPRVYTVAEDGSIRIPFLGTVRVQGLTAAQVRDEVGRQLAARNLKTNPSVSVTIRR